MSRPARAPIALTVVGGFLGAGKTTLLNQMLLHGDGRRTAVLVNDFGAVNVDSSLVATRGSETIELTNGCICCGIGNDLAAALMAVIERPDPPEAIVIEASGVSDPWRIAQVGLADPALACEGVVVLVDATRFLADASDPALADTLERQVKAADLLILNHCDRADAAQRIAVEERLQALAPRTPRFATEHARVPRMLLYGLSTRDGHVHHAGCGCEPQEPAGHQELFDTWSLQPAYVFRADALRDLLRAMPAGVIRLKGFLRTDEHGLALLQFAGRHGSLRPARDGANLEPVLVAIGLRGRLPRAGLAEALADAVLRHPSGKRP
jgi:G3E family GTPase